MRKLRLIILLIIFALVLFGCDTNSTPNDLVAPNLIGTKNIIHYIGSADTDYLEGISAEDSTDGDVTSLIIVDDDEVDLTAVGIYNLTYIASDKDGNKNSVTIQLTVIDLEQNQSPDYLNIFYINDLHGSILEDDDDDQMGLSKIANVLSYENTISPSNTLFIAGGDILQGSLLSNYFNGSSTMDIINNMQLEAFTIGNHEFDWEIDIITNFRDPNSDSLQVDFPLLGANIFLDGTTTRPTNIDAYTIIDKGDLKIGVIGVVGLGLEDTIATSKITGYYFDDPVYWTAHYAEYLRDVEEVDVVLAVIHDNDRGYNQAMGNLTGNQRIDAVFNGHSHSTYVQYITRTGARMPVIQSGSNGTSLGKVTLEFNDMRQVSNAFAENLTEISDARLRETNKSIDALIETYVTQIQPLLEDEIIVSGGYMSTTSLTYYMAELIRLASDSDIGFHNSGGTRAPLNSGEKITIATLYQIFPFDNKIKTVYLSGAEINEFKDSDYGKYYSTRVNNMIFEDDQFYKAATNDYVFDSTRNPFVYGTDIDDTGILVRDILETVLRNQKAAGYDSFLISNPIVLGQISSLEIALYLPKKNSYSSFLSM